VAATLVVEGDEDGCDDDDDDDDDDDKNNNNNSFRTDLVADWGSWPVGMEMSVKLLAEKRHRHNHRVSEKRREGFPKIGHYNTWEVESCNCSFTKTVDSFFSLIGRILVSSRSLFPLRCRSGSNAQPAVHHLKHIIAKKYF
jgi:hypothetical protein